LKRYLLDTNHLSALIDRQPALSQRVNAASRAGDRFGVCLPVLCEYRAGIRLGRRYRRNLARLQTSLAILRIWPCDNATIAEFAEIHCELRTTGRLIGPLDLLIASVVRRHNLILLTADQDFQNVSGIRIENWL
jgi:tRNA(fMet)-specific endonuclease VapC